MLIKKVRLENIRSYVKEDVEFPKGSILLSGDVGSGKSTVLQAVDFALFGITRDLEGASLLRNGASKGYVELNFEVDNKDVIVRRNLKRGSTITQDSGHITVNGNRKELMPSELKQFVLNLLNYPQELVTKSKSLMYRYTVYTPQEEMKQILFGNKDERLDTLRRVFGIDKYKRVIENSGIFVQWLKEQVKEITGRISDLSERKSERERVEGNISLLNKEIEMLRGPIDKIKDEVRNKNELIKMIEKGIKKFNDLKNEINLIILDVRNKNELVRKYNERISELDLQTKELKVEIKEEKVELVKKEMIAKLEKDAERLEKELEGINLEINKLNIYILNSKKITDSISKLTICPYCKQKVSRDHVHLINEEENKKISENSVALKELILRKENLSKELERSKKELQILVERMHKSELIKLKLSSLDEKNREMEKNLVQIEKIKNEIFVIGKKENELKSELRDYTDLDRRYSLERENLESLKEKEKELEIKKATFDSQILDAKKLLSDLEIEIERKEKMEKSLFKLRGLQYFLDKDFVKIVEIMEKKIMGKIHYDFNSMFQKWFSILMDNDGMKISLDEDFSPVIDLAGHLIDYYYLSGGEKTAVALAYRLALNQVINSLISTVKTRDLIILDEPTDGFSSDQVDKLKLVLDELNIAQVVLVSHEARIESFVDNVIRIEKEGHVSRVLD